MTSFLPRTYPYLLGQLVIACWLITFTPRVHAQPKSSGAVVILNPGTTLEEATRRALAAWQISLQAIDAAIPVLSMPGASDRAKALCLDHNARALIWISTNADGPALWLYDLADDRVLVRRLNVSPPWDEATAAAVALSIKTLLMHSKSAPPEERFGATPSLAKAMKPPPSGARGASPPCVVPGKPAQCATQLGER